MSNQSTRVYGKSLSVILLALLATTAKADQEFTVNVAASGGLEVKRGDAVWYIESAFSYPGEAIGWNRLRARDEADAGTSEHEITKSADGTYTLLARYHDYQLQRRVRPRTHHIEVTDTLSNTGQSDVGVLVEHRITSPGDIEDIRLCGAPAEAAIRADNPTVYLTQRSGSLGLIAADSVSRAQFHATSKEQTATLGLRHLGLKPGASVSLEWHAYPLPKEAGYFGFVNQVRKQWNVNYPIPGPADWFDVTKPHMRAMLQDEQKLRAFLKRHALKIVLLTPWLDYEHLNRTTGELVERDAYKTLMTDAYARFKAVDSDIQVLGCIEAPFVSLPQDLVKELLEVVPEKKSGYHDMTPEMLEVFKKHPTAWKQWGDSIVWTRDGHAKYEYYIRGEHHLIALTVRPVLGNGQHEYLMDQARYIVEDVGLDGFYIDSFTGAQHWHYGYSYDGWDGLTVDIDAGTGRITNRYTDLALAGAGSRKEIIEYGLDRHRIVVLNGHPIARETQRLPAIWFNESEWVFEPVEWMDAKPPWQARPCEAHFTSPIALGFRPLRYEEKGESQYAQIITKGMIAFLRHGILYFHYVTEIPESGDGRGGYGPSNHMFPITPVELGEGYVIGQERIITAVSRVFHWPLARRPRVLLFDKRGLPKDHSIEPAREEKAWRVDITLEDWNQIAVIE